MGPDTWTQGAVYGSTVANPDRMQGSQFASASFVGLLQWVKFGNDLSLGIGREF